MAMLNEMVDGSYKYDVFLSFRGEDTYTTFAGNLYYALRNKRIKTFSQHEFKKYHHNHSDEIPSSIITAIHESRISIVVLSKNYASSPLCLDELDTILGCYKNGNQVVLPIFYKVESWEVRNQEGEFGKALSKLGKIYQNRQRIHRWKAALTDVGLIAGWNYGTDQFQYELVEKIVDLTVQLLPRYDVFLSFYGDDTRYSFTGFLYQALRREGFKIFIDNMGVEGGNQISKVLLDAIEKSRISIVVLSENFGYSTWCLEELVKIMECKKTKNQLVWPIFYKIEKSDVSNQTKSYGEAMTAQENRFGKESENVQKWRSALSEVALLEGDHIKENEYEYKFIKKIVEKAIEAENHMRYQIPCTNDNLKEDLSSSSIDTQTHTEKEHKIHRVTFPSCCNFTYILQ